MSNAVVWLDIPVVDLDRAIRFYSAVMGESVARHEFPGMTIGLLPHGEQEIGACLFCDPARPPSAEGPLVYLNAKGRLDAAEAAVVPNGGKILQSKHAIGPYGFRTVFLDSEGNRLALHST
jgi:predicted enzyme related to lactoylglutathione lyase